MLKSKSFRKAWVTLSFCGMASCALAATPVMDLRQIYHAALEQDATVRAARAAADVGRERLPQAKAQLMPTVTANIGKNNNDLNTTSPNLLGQDTTTNDKYLSDNRTLQLRQPLFNMQRWLQFEQAKSLVSEVEATLDREYQNLVVRVSVAYFETLMAGEQLDLVLAQKATYTALVDAAKKSLTAGSGTRTDIDDAQSRLDMAMAQELEARQNQDLTRRQLQLLVNQPVMAVAKLNVPALKLASPQPARLDDWTVKAEQNSPEIKALQARLEAARQEVKKAQAGLWMQLPSGQTVATKTSHGLTRATKISLLVCS